MKDLSSFLYSTCLPMFEAVNTRDLAKAQRLCADYLVKRKIYTYPLPQSYKIDSSEYTCLGMFEEGGSGAYMAFDSKLGSTEVAHVAFFKKMDFSYLLYPENFVADIVVYAKGANIMQCVKLVEAVLSGKIPMTDSDVRDFIFNAQIFEDQEQDVLNEDLLSDLKKQKKAMYMKIRHNQRQNKDVSDLQAQYDEIVKKYNEVKISIKTDVLVAPVLDRDIEEAENRFEEKERAAPKERFEDMKAYVFNVLKGIQPLALICGAPGIGKTYKILNTIKTTAGPNGTMTMGVDWELIKAKCTPTSLFTMLHDYKKPGQILVFDDCDNIFKDENSINLLKAAYDSSDERWVTWNISTPIVMSDEDAESCDDAVWNEKKSRWEYPKKFLYEGGGIIITNYRAGQIDTAVKNRALICDLDFSTDEILDIIKEIAPKIKPGMLSNDAREKALNYLQEMVDQKIPVELSVRSFVTCACLFDSEMPENSVKRQIREQMRLQFARGGKKY